MRTSSSGSGLSDPRILYPDSLECLIDGIYMECPFFGQRQLRNELQKLGHHVGRFFGFLLGQNVAKMPRNAGFNRFYCTVEWPASNHLNLRWPLGGRPTRKWSFGKVWILPIWLTERKTPGKSHDTPPVPCLPLI
jgi:hypothetical protein